MLRPAILTAALMLCATSPASAQDARNSSSQRTGLTEAEAREQCDLELNINSRSRVTGPLPRMRRECINQKLGR